MRALRLEHRCSIDEASLDLDADVAQYAQLCAFAIVVALLAGLPFAATRPLIKRTSPASMPADAAALDRVIVGLALRFAGAGSLGLIELVPVHLLRKSQRTRTSMPTDPS